jgi:putative membrane protein
MMYGWSMGLEAWLWMGAWILVLAALVWLLVREPRRAERDSAMETLRARLARGEISAEEFEHAQRLLEPGRPQENPR